MMTLVTLATWTPAPLDPSVTVEAALGLVLDDSAGVLPVVDPAGRLLGVVTESDLLDASGPDAPVSTVLRSMPVTIAADAHVFEATKLLVRHDLEAIAVVDDDGQYLGFARRHDIFERFAQMLATNDPGAVVSVEVAPRDLALSQLVYAAEQNGVRVRAVVMEPHIVHDDGAGRATDLDADDPDGARRELPTLADEPLVRVTLKLDTTDAARVRAMFEHYGYRVVASYGEREDDEDLSERVQAFMRYLDV